MLSSPILLIKNFNRDYGRLLAELIDTEKQTHVISGRSEASSGNWNSLTHTARSAVQAQADAVLNLCVEALGAFPAHDRNECERARQSLRVRMPYSQTGTVVYSPYASLDRHCDDHGGWVVVFSVRARLDLPHFCCFCPLCYRPPSVVSRPWCACTHSLASAQTFMLLDIVCSWSPET